MRTSASSGGDERWGGLLQRLRRSLEAAGAREPASDEERGENAAMILATTLMAIFAALWSVLYVALGRYTTAAIPGTYAVVTAASLLLLKLSGRIGWYRISQILLILILPFGVQASLGGFAQGSAVMIWAFLPVMGALIFHNRYAFVWLSLYFVGLVTLAVLDAELRAAVVPMPPAAVSAFWAGNIGGISLIVFLVMRRFIDYVRQQRTLAEQSLRKIQEQAEELAVARERLEKEVEVARRIQLAMLPRKTSVTGLEIATRMTPATEVGGDYFDVLPDEGGCWIGVGDVSGHGLTAGLVMLMVQSVVATLVERDPTSRPADVVEVLNRVLFDNVRHRLEKDEFVTFCLLRCSNDGRVELAGAHEPILVLRARTGRCEVVPTPGTWLAVVRDIRGSVFPTSLALEPGDLLLLHTDGITEAASATGERFGLERLTRLVEEASAEAVEEIRDRVFGAVAAWEAEQADDATLLVLRYRGPAGAAARA